MSPARETGGNGRRSSKSGTAFDSRSEAWVTPLDSMKPPQSTMTFSWYCNPDALPALVVLQRASVSTGFSGILPSGLWKYLTSSYSTPSLSAVVLVSTKRPFSSMACSLNSATVIPLGSNP